ncbi:MAG: hypothetical protein U0Q11_23300 [Vicinamibacterales bacterium]
MQPARTETPRSQSAHLLIVGLQIALTLVAVLVSRMNLGVTMGSALVMGIATLNGAVVATTLLGARRNGTLISGLVICMIVFIAGLLIWPAWDTAYRARVF